MSDVVTSFGSIVGAGVRFAHVSNVKACCASLRNEKKQRVGQGVSQIYRQNPQRSGHGKLFIQHYLQNATLYAMPPAGAKGDSHPST